MKKKFTQFRWLVTMLLLVTAMAMPKMAWAEIKPTKPSSGEGTAASPYQIGTPEELYWFAALVNGTLTDGTNKNPSACAVLVKDITVNENLLSSKLDENGDPKDNLTVQSWTPIGYYISSSDYVYYKGTFDGNGYSISGLYVKYTNQGEASFIGDIEEGCVKNIAILDSYFEGSSLIGGIVGYLNNGIINNCLFSGTVKSQDKVGGICGAIQGDRTISDCFSNAKILVDKADNYCGGICGVGWNSLIKLRNCVYNNSLYTGEAIKWRSSAGTVEHITGMETAEIASGKATYWLNRYKFGDGIGWHQNIDNGQTEDAYPVLDNTHGVVYTSQPCPSSGIFSNTKPSSSEGHNWGENNVCTKCGKTKDVLDLVEGFQEPSQVGGVYQISTAGELYWFTALVNGNCLLTDGTPSNNSANAVLTSDITVNSNVLDESGNLAVTSDTRLDWIPIGNSDRPYTGTFDGQGYTISGLYFNDSSKDYVGLFGYIYGKIQNTGVIDSYFEGDQAVGGLCGNLMRGEIKDCFSRSFVKGRVEVGGVCGDVSGSKVENAYQAGIVCGSSETETTVNGIFGGIYYNSTSGNSQCSNCYYDTTLCPNMNACGSTSSATNVEGKTTSQFASGEVAYLLNNSVSDGTQRWYQNLAAEAYPNLNNTDKGNRTVYSAYRHGETTLTYNNNNTHAHAYDSYAANEENGNHDMSYQGEFTWADNDNNATVTATFTCSVCGKVVEPELTVVHDDSHTNTEADCINNGYKYYKTSHAFAGAIFTDSYTQTVPALGHYMNIITFKEYDKIYSNKCQRKNCGYIGYYATSDGSVEAKYEDGVYKVPFLCLYDAKAYDSKAEYTVESLTYQRTFSHDKWVAVYVPFAIDCSLLPDYMEMAIVNNFHEYEQTDGSYNVVLEVKRKTSGTIPALTPCVMRLKTELASATEKKIQLSNVPFSAAADNYIDCSSVTRYYKFTGSLAGKAANSLNGDTDFVLNAGTLHKANTETTLKAQRWYLTATDRNGSSTSLAPMLQSISINVIGDSDGDVTGIEDIHVVTEKANSARDGIFDLQGRRLNSEPTNGIYIKNGVKYVK